MKKSNINKNFSNRKGKEKLYEKTESNNVMNIYAEVTEWKKKESLNEVFDKILDYMVIQAMS